MVDAPSPERWVAAPRRTAGIASLVFALLSLGLAAQEPRSVASHLEEIDATARAAVEGASDEEAVLIEADLEFAADAKSRHVADAFADRFLADGVLIGEGAPVIIGPTAVREALQGSRAEWHWAPVRARVSGDLGVTWGIAALVIDDKNTPQVYRSRYVTVWNRDAEGTWRIAIDIGNEGPGPG